MRAVYRFFENLVDPYPETTPPELPRRLLPFLWTCTRGMRPYIGYMTFGTALIGAFEALLFSASAFAAFDRYQLEAAIQSAHVVRRRGGETAWAAIERLRLGAGNDTETAPRPRWKLDALAPPEGAA